MEGARRNCVLIILSLVFFSVLAFISGLSVFLMINYSITGPSPVSAECKVLSSSVDLRSSKVCELGPLNYRNKNVLYPKERPRHKCHYDYYWASVFQVEYRPYQSGRTLQALAEAPKEALPLNCRPNFSSAWLTKNQFKVNETYACKYTPGASKVDIYGDGLFNCHREDPSAFELMRRFYNL
ncbi:uncharacterized protein LOC18443940 [Amborella trichopoda]|uniref:Uncharacterized protein n=1 Tax=Amborella trichopoda TaxID=13333 RepID=U5CZQ8_AMBTC|nr:uncharacterized protein LOC18443940 [Amborella trichopoda]ERN15649.1 hypothetical protein AMTR_s00048p00202300 [Amborella trichopoda]|eukprot:XP_006854182.1 uncharacterized protein LOC18443940 [Amborella trichopoda]